MRMFDYVQKINMLDDYIELDETDFYPPEDDRVHVFGIDDIENGDNYDDYVKLFWEEYESEIYDL